MGLYLHVMFRNIHENKLVPVITCTNPNRNANPNPSSYKHTYPTPASHFKVKHLLTENIIKLIVYIC